MHMVQITLEAHGQRCRQSVAVFLQLDLGTLR